MQNRILSIFRIETQFDEKFWAGAIIALLYFIQLCMDGSIHL